METYPSTDRATNLHLVKTLGTKINPEELPDDLLREYAQFLCSLDRVVVGKKMGGLRFLNKLFYLLTFLLFPTCILHSQCLVPPAAPSCSPAGATALVNNDVIPAGQVRTINGNASYNSLTVSGGTLVVCASLTLNTISFSSGTLIINPGASVLINSSSAIVFGSNSSIINYGSFKITSSIVTGQNNLFFNASTSSVFTIAFNQFVIQGPNTYIINNGVLNASYIITQSSNSPGPICSGAGSYMVCNFMINQFANAFLSPSGPSCINITQTIINSQPMTATPSVMICYQASNVSIIGSANFGSATVNSNCPSCLVALPIRLTSLSGVCSGSEAVLRWTAEDETGLEKYVIEKSNNGLDFYTVGTVNPTHTSGSHHYNYSLSLSDAGSDHYFRIKELSSNNDYAISEIIFADCSIDETVIYPSETSDLFTLKSSKGIQAFSLFDLAGRLIRQEKAENRKLYVVDVSEFSAGTYIVKMLLTSHETVCKKLVHY